MNNDAFSTPAHEAFANSWCIRPLSYERFLRAIRAAAPKARGAVNPEPEDDGPKCRIENGVGVIPLVGVMMRNPGWLTEFGACDTVAFERAVAKYADDPAVTAILLDVDSPGGSVMGTPEAAEAVTMARSQKPVLAYSGGLMCSAAYWVAARADAVYCSTSAIVGSIGCYAPVYDASRLYAAAGVSVEVIRSGRFKGGNVEGAPISAEYKANLQRIVDGIGAQFRASVTAMRPGVNGETMEGQEFIGGDGIPVGLIDSVAGYPQALADAGALAGLRG